MKKILYLSLMIFLLVSPSAFADPATEVNKKSQVTEFKPVYFKVPNEWSKVEKSSNDYIRMIYHYNDDTILNIYETSAKGKTLINTVTTEKIVLNNITYHFSPVLNYPKGGNLNWINQGIYFEMDSIKLDKNQMLELANKIIN
ncbi:hypothetical protein BK138_34230 [Paenibacillus rhizosphaerae]|uniref:DUF4367 domain-containing protein n=1 Tax=Paenibacillus rhizosphaerae TaxID=297318 RepID=A0A1R1DZM9_9BACL|nr:hypothetical protein [Paenibacillus rhizosphaerae]OMF45027.1 hypothetical protein BK138_34230 [Paenibacillus rhizosphaerae]